MAEPNHVPGVAEMQIRQPPVRFTERLRFLGPGFILSASIVGSGELIATTVLGAEAGFAALWIIIISCLAKVTVQLEFGQHAIMTGQTTMQSFQQIKGPTFLKARWPVWTVMLMTLLKCVQVGGILGGTSVVLHMLLPDLPAQLGTILLAISAAWLIYNGEYGRIEKLSIVMIALFTILTLSALIAIQFTEFSFSWSDISQAFRISFTPAEMAVALGAFGITGVASDEVIAYNYWCIEKGYATYTGPDDGTPAWRERANGWIKVMYLDATVAMLIYTTVTIAFYLLGAAVLHGRTEIPAGNKVIETLALIYTQTLGPGVRLAYLIGAFFVLYSSLYASLAAWTRLFSDIFRQFQWVDLNDVKSKKRIIAVLACVFPAIWTTLYLFIDTPVIMILSGGVVGSVLLVLVVYVAIHFKKIREPRRPSGTIYTLAFWISVVSILAVAITSLRNFMDALK